MIELVAQFGHVVADFLVVERLAERRAAEAEWVGVVRPEAGGRCNKKGHRGHRQN